MVALGETASNETAANKTASNRKWKWTACSCAIINQTDYSYILSFYMPFILLATVQFCGFSTLLFFWCRVISRKFSLKFLYGWSFNRVNLVEVEKKKLAARLDSLLLLLFWSHLRSLSLINKMFAHHRLSLKISIRFVNVSLQLFDCRVKCLYFHLTIFAFILCWTPHLATFCHILPHFATFCNRSE